MTPLRHTLFFVLSALLFNGCHPDREAPSPNPPIPPDTEMCGAMCSHLNAISCEEGKDYYDADVPGPRGVPNATCEHLCRVQQGNGVFINPRCVAQVPACDKVEEWRKKTCQ